MTTKLTKDDILAYFNEVDFNELKEVINEGVKIRKARREEKELTDKTAKLEAKVAGSQAGAAFIKSKKIGDIISYKDAAGNVALMVIKNIKENTVSGTKVDADGKVILNDKGKPAPIWRYFYQLVITDTSIGEVDEDVEDEYKGLYEDEIAS